MVLNITKAYQITKHVHNKEDKETGQYELKDYLSLRAKVIFPNRNQTVIQVVLRRKRTGNRTTGEQNQTIWFYSVYEPRRGI
jgi:hypothetical protein